MPSLFVICREPLPTREDCWSFHAGPVQVARDEPRVLRLSTPTFATGLLAEALGELVAHATRGLLIAEGQRVLADFDGAPAIAASDFKRQLQELLADLEAELVHEANDWSDVESAA